MRKEEAQREGEWNSSSALSTLIDLTEIDLAIGVVYGSYETHR
jgi:hypothetical protein